MKTKKWLCRNAHYQAERSTGVASQPLTLPSDGIPPGTGTTASSPLERRDGVGGQALSLPSSEQCFVFHSKRKRNSKEPFPHQSYIQWEGEIKGLQGTALVAVGHPYLRDEGSAIRSPITSGGDTQKVTKSALVLPEE